MKAKRKSYGVDPDFPEPVEEPVIPGEGPPDDGGPGPGERPPDIGDPPEDFPGDDLPGIGEPPVDLPGRDLPEDDGSRDLPPGVKEANNERQSFER